jgi:hypothetical protein
MLFDPIRFLRVMASSATKAIYAMYLLWKFFLYGSQFFVCLSLLVILFSICPCLSLQIRYTRWSCFLWVLVVLARHCFLYVHACHCIYVTPGGLVFCGSCTRLGCTIAALFAYSVILCLVYVYLVLCMSEGRLTCWSCPSWGSLACCLVQAEGLLPFYWLFWVLVWPGLLFLGLLASLLLSTGHSLRAVYNLVKSCLILHDGRCTITHQSSSSNSPVLRCRSFNCWQM